MLPQLAVFDASARHRSFTRAAEELHMAQPTVTAQMHKLTETIGLPLYEQIGRQIFLTEAGRCVHEHARQVLAALRGLDDALTGLRGLAAGTLRIAAGTVARGAMPVHVANFAARHPGLDVVLSFHNRRALGDRLAANEDDLYVFADPPDDRELVRQMIGVQPVAVLARADDPLAGRPSVALEELVDGRFIVRESGSGARSLVEAAFASRGLAPRFRIEMTDDLALHDAVRAGLGVALLPCAPGARTDGLVALDVAGIPRARSLSFVYPVGRELGPAAEAFLATVRAATLADGEP